MASVLVYFGSGEGQTATIADRIATVLRERGHDATSVDADGADATDLELAAYDAVLVGASVHAGKHQASVREFVTSRREALRGKPTAFFQVSLSSATEEGQDQAAGYVEEFLDATGWNPDRIGQFGGALRFSEFGFLERFAIKQIAKREFPDLDTSRDAEFTDWQAVEDFANDVGAFVEGRLGRVPPGDESQVQSR